MVDSVNTYPPVMAAPDAVDGHKLHVETHSIDYVPLRERHGKVWHLFPVWFAGDAHLATIAVGVIGISLGGNLLWTAIAVVLGSFFGSFFMAFHSTQGPQLGLPQMVQSRPQFGFIGALLVWIVALVTYVGYTGFNQILVGSTLSSLASVPPWASYVGYAAVGVVLAIVGYDVIHKASRWLTLMMLVVLLTFSIGMVVVHPLSSDQLSFGSFSVTPFLIQFFTAAVYQLSWSIYVSDYSRYLPPSVGVRASFWWTYLGAGFGGAWMMLVGTVVAGLFPKAEIVPAVIDAGDRIFPHFGTILLVVSVLPLITIGTLNFYGGSLTLLSMLDSVKRVRLTLNLRVAALVLIGILSTAIALFSNEGFAEQFGSFLTVLGYLFTPWTAINLVDFYIVRRGHYSIREIFNPRGMYGRWNWRGLVAYAVGFAAMMPFAVVGSFEGPIAHAMGGVDVSMIVGLAVAVAVYWIVTRSLDLDEERRIAAIADRGLEAEAVVV